MSMRKTRKWGSVLEVARVGTEIRTQSFQESSLVGGGGMGDLQRGVSKPAKLAVEERKIESVSRGK